MIAKTITKMGNPPKMIVVYVSSQGLCGKPLWLKYPKRAIGSIMSNVINVDILVYLSLTLYLQYTITVCNVNNKKGRK